MIKYIILIVLCLLSHIEALGRKHHRRRSIENDPRFFGFSFEAEPLRNTSASGPTTLNCQYVLARDTHVKEVRIEWRRDGALVEEKTNPKIKIFSNGSLLLNEISSSEEGTYQCVVHVSTQPSSDDSSPTTWTFLSRKALIKASDLSKFELQPVDRSVGKGQPTAFHCLTLTRPAPNVTWYHNDKTITPGGEYHFLPVSNTLEISSAQSRHEGVYKCVVEGAGKRRTSQSAKLALSSAAASSELTFVTSPRLQSVEVGEDVILECLGTAKNRPEVKWLKDSRQIIIDGVHVRRVGISSLLIRDANTNDSGLYTCRLSNSDDSLDKAVAVNVRSPPHLTTRPQTKVALETADVEFECLASGRPEAKISWLKNGETIIPSEYFVIEPNKLRILGLVKADQGVYECIAENEVGSEQASAQLLIDAADSSSVAASSGQPKVASSPLGLRTSSIGSRFIVLEWDPPVQRNGNIMRYHVFFKEVDSSRERMLNSSTTSATVTSLQPATLYILRVAAENEAGIGASSDSLKVSTNKEQAVPGRVNSLVAVATGSETIDIKWTPPAGGQPPLRYKLFYVRDPPDEEKETLTITSSTMYTLHGMNKYTTYALRVEAEGENGSGLSSEIVKVRTLSDEPSSPPQNIGADSETSTSIRVSWQPPEEDKVHGEITGYRLKFKTKARGSKGNTLVIDSTAREYVMSGLEPNTQYLVRMAVVNHNGTGPYSDWLSVDTPSQDKEERVLGAPTELRYRAGPDYIAISWLPPADDTVLVRGYQIGWGLGVPDLETEKVGASVTQHKITRLQSERDYVVSLRAFNNQGSGFPIYETVRTESRSSIPHFGDEDDVLPNSKTATPVQVRAEAQSATSVRVSWTEGDNNAFNNYYTVRYSTSVDGNQQRYVNSSETWIAIDGLRPATEYEFAVRSISSEGGYSTWSLALRSKTHSAAPSSAPRDLTVLPAESGDPHAVSLHWQPPKYANGEIEEYIIYYTDRESLADKDWMIDYLPGDKHSHQINNLLPKASYFFKIQARNNKGYGPFSSVQGYTSSGGVVLSSKTPKFGAGTIGGDGTKFDEIRRILVANPLYMVLIAAFAIILLLLLVLIVMCCLKKSGNKNGYTSGTRTHKASALGGAPTDLWIQPNGSHMRAGASDYMVDGLATAQLVEAVDSPTPHGVRYGQGTLSRSYHQSSTSLEGARQRTPQVVYTGTGRHQPIAKIEFESPYGSSSAIGSSATPPLPMQAPPSGPPVVIDGYRTLRGTPPNSASALRSFTQLAGAPPPPAMSSVSSIGSVRPVVVAAGGRQLPVGRATAQPRVNVANIYSPYASCSSDGESEKKHKVELELRETPSRVEDKMQPSHSTEELNAQMENLDTMIDDLQAMQQEFDVTP